MKYLVVISFVSVFFLTSCFNDLGCLFQFPDEDNLQTIFEILAEDDLSKFTILRKTSYSGEAIDFTHEYTFSSERYTLDRSFSIFDNYSDRGYFNYGNSISIFENPLKIEYYDFEYYSIDHFPEMNSSLFISNERFYLDLYIDNKLDSISTANRFVVNYNHSSLEFDTLLSYFPQYLDSTKILETAPVKIRFNSEGNTLLKLVHFESIISNSSDSSLVLEEGNTLESSLIELTPTGVDTLFKTDGSKRFDYELTTSDVYITIQNQGTYVLGENREITFLNNSYLPVLFSIDETIYQEKYSEKVYNLIDNSVFDLEDHVENSFLLFPDRNKMIIKKRNIDDVIYFFDYDSKMISDSITVFDLPDLGNVQDEDFSRFRFRNPIYTENGNLIFMLDRRSYLTDPDFKCYD
ncbi:MAG: hypothetical protein RIE52_12260 [Balneola sp.]|jgi:hypothetical protein